jgi:radical SAM superfamily enzyme YgiQ (UPF0313 family)
MMAATPTTRALLVFPRFNPHSFWALREPCEAVGAKAPAPPLGLLTLAAMLPEHWDIRLVNRNFEEMTAADLEWADLVLTGGMLPQAPDTQEIILTCKAAGVPVAIGGPSPTSTPEDYPNADFIVVGEAEGILPEFVAAWERGERSGTFTAEKFKADVTTTPIPRFDLINFRDYLFVGVQFSRGCPFTCEFCDIIELYGRAPRTKTTPQMLAELDRLYELGHRGHVDFVDDNLIGNKKAVKAFLPHLIEWQQRKGYPFRFSTEASLNLSDDAELLDMMSRAGFFIVFCGIESPDDATLVAMSKKQNTRRSLAESVHKIYAAGIFVTGGFIVGFDTEKGSVANNMMACIKDTSIPIAIVGLLVALPNTQLSRRLRKEGRMFDTFFHMSADAADSCLAGLNFTTLRSRRDILKDYRDTVAAVYSPENYFARVQHQGDMLRIPKLPGAKIHWRMAVRDVSGFGRAIWRLTVKYPELRRGTVATLFRCLRNNPRAIISVMMNVGAFLHHYQFAKFVVAEVDKSLELLDSGTWVEPTPIPALTGAAAHPQLAAVA